MIHPKVPKIALDRFVVIGYNNHIEARQRRKAEVMNRTDEQHQVLGKWMRYGIDSFVTKRGSGWIVTIAGYSTPFVFKTRKAARESAEKQVRHFVAPQ